MREFISAETEIATRLVQKALVAINNHSKRWEWLAGIDFKSYELVEFRTDQWSNGVNLGQRIDCRISKGGAVIIHHNHVTLNSLSVGDWRGLANTRGMVENWVHCWDATRYQGKIIEGHEKDVLRYCADASDSPFKNDLQRWNDKLSGNVKLADQKFAWLLTIPSRFVNKGMREKDWMEYEYEFGSTLKPLIDEFTQSQSF